jgi:hypothetical protein
MRWPSCPCRAWCRDTVTHHPRHPLFKNVIVKVSAQKYCLYSSSPRPPLWSSGQSSWLQIQRSGFDSQNYQIFWELVGLERGPLSLVSTTEELLGRKSNGSGLETENTAEGDPPRWPRETLYPQKLVLTSLTSGGHSVGIICLRTQSTEYVLFVFLVSEQQSYVSIPRQALRLRNRACIY